MLQWQRIKPTFAIIESADRWYCHTTINVATLLEEIEVSASSLPMQDGTEAATLVSELRVNGIAQSNYLITLTKTSLEKKLQLQRHDTRRGDIQKGTDHDSHQHRRMVRSQPTWEKADV